MAMKRQGGAIGRRPFLLGILAALLLACAAQADPHDFYRAGLRAYQFEYWREALVFFEAALAEEPQAGGMVREYGMWKEPYLPYFYQGMALYKLGRWSDALESWEESKRQGAIETRRSRKHVRTLENLQAELRKHLAQETGELYRGAAGDFQQLENLRQTPGFDAAARDTNLPNLVAIEALLETSRQRLTDDSLGEAAAELARARELLLRARSGIENIQLELEQRQLEVELQRRQEEKQAREARMLETRERATRILDTGGPCEEALDLLEGLEQEDPTALFPAGSLSLLLARAHLACDQLPLAQHYLERAQRERTASGADEALDDLDEQLESMREHTGSPAGSDQQTHLHHRNPEGRRWADAWADYLLAEALSRDPECRSTDIEHLLDNAHRVLGERGNSGEDLNIPYRPDLVRARSYRTCGHRERVEENLARARRRAADGEDGPEVRELAAWLEANPRPEPYTGSYALLVGSWNYQHERWHRLEQPALDIYEIRRALKLHGFQVEVVENPTYETLLAALDSFFFRHGAEPGHRLVFYYAGHGHTEITRHGVKLGFVVPIDAGDPKADRGELQSLLGMERFREYAIRAEANDMLFMFDSCFAGTVFEATRACVPPDCGPNTGPAAGLTTEELVARPVRMFLTAGDESQQVPDRSLFRTMVTRALGGEADRDGDRLVLGRELGSFVKNQVVLAGRARAARFETARLRPPPAVPQWGTLEEASFGEGDLLFDPPPVPPPPRDTLPGSLRTQMVYWQTARRYGTAADYALYLKRFPQGAFVPLARHLLTSP